MRRNFVLTILFVLLVGVAAVFAMPTSVEAGHGTATSIPPTVTATPTPRPQTTTTVNGRSVPVYVEVVTPTPRPQTTAVPRDIWITVTIEFTGGGEANAQWTQPKSRLVNELKSKKVSSGESVRIPSWSWLSVTKLGCRSYAARPGYPQTITLDCE